MKKRQSDVESNLQELAMIRQYSDMGANEEMGEFVGQ